MLSIAYLRSPIGWIASHRMHHAYSDSEKDPHSAKHIGFWTVLLTLWHISDIPAKFAKDLYQNPRLVFFHKHHFKILMAHWVISYMIHPYFFIAYALIPFIFAKIGFGLLNTLGHKDKGGTNVPWLNLFIAGEGYHQAHHNDSKRIRLNRWDLSGWLAEKLFVNESDSKK